MLRAFWSSTDGRGVPRYSSIWTDGHHACIIEDAVTEVEAAHPWRAPAAGPEFIRRILDEVGGNFDAELSRSLKTAIHTGETIRASAQVLARIGRTGAGLVIGPHGRGVWRLVRIGRSWYVAAPAAKEDDSWPGFGLLEDAFVHVIWSLPEGVLTVYAGPTRANPFNIYWRGVVPPDPVDSA